MKLNLLSNFKNSRTQKILLRQQETYLKEIYATYNELKTSENFIPYQVFTNQFLILNNIKKQDSLWEELVNERDEYVKHKNQIAYRDFYISWSINPRFSSNVLVPIISKTFDSNTQALSWNTAESSEIEDILTKYNDYLDYYLVEQDASVELIPGIIIKYNYDLKDYNLYFDPELIKDAYQED
ncbi:MSC_0623 family F1-like ATPase-associated protein [Mycoplasma sp. VS30B]